MTAKKPGSGDAAAAPPQAPAESDPAPAQQQLSPEAVRRLRARLAHKHH
jgi:hypothetical protein